MPKENKSVTELEIVEKPARDMRVATRAMSFDIESIFKLAIEKEGTAETLEKLMGIRREINAELSKKAFDEAMALFQAECPVVTKTKGVPTATGKLAYYFAPFEFVIATVKPFLQKHGFSYTLDTDTESAAGWVIAKCHVTHSGGHSMTSTAKFPLGTKTGIMSETQVFAAALTFASRRVFQNAFGIVCAGEDLNGQTDKPKPLPPSSLAAEPSVKDLARELWVLLKPVRGAEQNCDDANQFLIDESVIGDQEFAPEFTPERFREVIEKSKTKLKELNKIP